MKSGNSASRHRLGHAHPRCAKRSPPAPAAPPRLRPRPASRAAARTPGCPSQQLMAPAIARGPPGQLGLAVWRTTTAASTRPRKATSRGRRRADAARRFGVDAPTRHSASARPTPRITSLRSTVISPASASGRRRAIRSAGPAGTPGIELALHGAKRGFDRHIIVQGAIGVDFLERHDLRVAKAPSAVTTTRAPQSRCDPTASCRGSRRKPACR